MELLLLVYVSKDMFIGSCSAYLSGGAIQAIAVGSQKTHVNLVSSYNLGPRKAEASYARWRRSITSYATSKITNTSIKLLEQVSIPCEA